MEHLLPHGPFWGPFAFAAGIYGVRYVVLAGVAFGIWYRRGAAGKIQAAMPRGAQVRREITYSVAAVLIFGA